ncbi:MAG: Ig-like domain-containing protein, partial [Patescibacteria group bacterium]
MSRKKIFISAGLVSALAVLAVLFIVHPTMAGETESFAQQAGLSTQGDIKLIVARLIRTFLGFLGILAIVIIIAGGFMYMTAHGDQERVKKARQILINGLIGLVIVLMSFTIAHFVVKSVAGATGGTTECIGPNCEDCTGPDCNSFDPRYKHFVLKSFNSQCANTIRNFQPQFIFSKNVDRSTVLPDGIVIKYLDDNGTTQRVDGSLAIVGNVVTFTPTELCGEGYPGAHCFNAGGRYEVKVSSSIKSATGNKTLQCDIYNKCDFDFKAGDIVDTQAPDVVMDSPDNGMRIIRGGVEQLHAITYDDAGASMVDFKVNTSTIFTSGNDFSTPNGFTSVAPYDGLFETLFFTDPNQEWNTRNEADINKIYRLSATGYDCAGNQTTSAPVSVLLRGETCGNGIQDADLGETDVDCGGDENGDYYCGACDCDPDVETCPTCSNHYDCAGGYCNPLTNACESRPVIKRVSPGDGAPKNIISILGEGFGNQVGELLFLPAVQAQAPDCNKDGWWSRNQILVTVPELSEGVRSGALTITTFNGKTDSTDDDWGPFILDFQVSQIVRPGICELTPPAQEYSQPMTISGINFNDAQSSSVVYIGDTNPTINSWGQTEISSTVPIMGEGTYATQVYVGNDLCKISRGPCVDNDDCPTAGDECEAQREGSNEVLFNLLSPTAGSYPEIQEIISGWKACEISNEFCNTDADCDTTLTPVETCVAQDAWGPSGQYITIKGVNFGGTLGSVWFLNPDDDLRALGDVEFPDYCDAFDQWHEESVIVKVPRFYNSVGNGNVIMPVANDKNHVVFVERHDAVRSNEKSFRIIMGVPTPGICAIDPVSGPVQTPVTLYGEAFGSTQGQVFMYSGLDSSGVPQYTPIPEGSMTDWNNGDIEFDTISSAQTGPVYLTNSSNVNSNPVDFKVGDCNKAEDKIECGDGTQCCSDGTCSSSCLANDGKATYSYLFSTSKIPKVPYVLQACDPEASVVSPSPSTLWSSDVCLNSVITATFSEAMKQDSINSNSVKVYTCDSIENDRCSGASEATGSFISKGDISFTWAPSAGTMAPNAFYYIELLGGQEVNAIKSVEGIPLGITYSWFFNTGGVESHCQIGNIIVVPGQYTASEQFQEIDYLAMPLAAEDECIVVSCQGQTLYWGSSSEDHATLDPEVTNNICASTATAFREIPEVDITAETNIATDDVYGLAKNLGGMRLELVDNSIFTMNPEFGLELSSDFPIFVEAAGVGIPLDDKEIQFSYNDRILGFEDGTKIYRDDLAIELAGGIQIPFSQEIPTDTTLPFEITYRQNNRMNILYTREDGSVNEIRIYSENYFSGHAMLVIYNESYQNRYYFNKESAGFIEYETGNLYNWIFYFPIAGNTSGISISNGVSPYIQIRIRPDGSGYVNKEFAVQKFDNFINELPDVSSVSGTGELEIAFTPPDVIGKWPACNAACVNAAVGATFNVPMKESMLTESNITIEKCEKGTVNEETKTCTVVTSPLDYFDDANIELVTETDVDERILDTVAREFIISPKINFDKNSIYKVTIKPEVQSLSGKELRELYSAGYSWIFRTKDSDIACTADRVDVRPSYAQKDRVGETQEFYGFPFGAPDSCAINGQMLKATDVVWGTWTATDDPNAVGAIDSSDTSEIVASLMLNGRFPYSQAVPQECSSKCLNTGTSISLTDDICGDGVVSGNEECDVAIAGTTNCSDVCLHEPVTSACEFTCGGATDGLACTPTVTTCTLVDGVAVCDSGVCEGTASCQPVDPVCCGNGRIDSGEECDDWNSADGDACTSQCMNAGTYAGMAMICNEATDDPVNIEHSDRGGEECWDGNLENGDGCSSSCLREGSIPADQVYAVCGGKAPRNSALSTNVEPGEDCDGEVGCSASCQHIGTSACVKRCGGSATGKNCNFDTECDAGVSCSPINTPCCGNTIKEDGEDCDDGNSKSGDGCSTMCLNEGSNMLYTVPSICGNGGDFETGEECEAPTTDGDILVGPRSIAIIQPGAVFETHISSIAPVGNFATSKITAYADSASGSAKLALSCSCSTDESCGEVETFGCGKGNCCLNRPKQIDTYPTDTATGVCRNTAVSVTFSEELDTNSFGSKDSPNIYLKLVTLADGSTPNISTCPHEWQKLASANNGLFARVMGWLSRGLDRLIGTPVSAQGDEECLVPVISYDQIRMKGTLSRGGVDYTSWNDVSFRFNSVLAPDADYQTVIVGDDNISDDIKNGLLSLYNVSMDVTAPDGIVASFTTRPLTDTDDGICKVDEVTATDTGKIHKAVYEDASPNRFSKTAEEHLLIAKAFSNAGGTGPAQEIQPTIAYDWSWVWNSSIRDSRSNNVVRMNMDDSDAVCGSDTDGDGLGDDCDHKSSAFAAGSEGEEKAIAAALVPHPEILGEEKFVVGFADMSAILCENPWPAIGNFADTRGNVNLPAGAIEGDPIYTNFGFHYCRDNAGQRLLPTMNVNMVEPRIDDLDILREFLFVIPTTKDALGVRILRNPADTTGARPYLAPEQWYAQQGFGSAPARTTVNGYEALQSGTTLYVFAVNKQGPDADHLSIYQNIYAISYNPDATEKSKQIFEQIIRNWKFNTNTDEITDINLCSDGDTYIQDAEGGFVECTWDGQCGAGNVCESEKSKLARDYKRILDLQRLRTTLDGKIATGTGLPKLDEGSFIRGRSISKWPSWSAELSNNLGTALPTDPINQFIGCGAFDSITDFVAPTKGGTETDDAYNARVAEARASAVASRQSSIKLDPQTCFAGTTGEFSCSEGSLIYGFRSTQSDRDQYDVYMTFETDESLWAEEIPEHSLGLCRDDATYGISAACGDGILGEYSDGTAELCEIGESFAMPCTDAMVCNTLNPYFYGKTCETDYDCSFCKDPAECDPDDEECLNCEIESGTSCDNATSRKVCSNPTDLKMNGKSCTDITLCGVDGTCINANGMKRLSCVEDGDDTSSTYGECRFNTVLESTNVCMPLTCGNGVVDAGEKCDEGLLNGTYGHCSSSCQFTNRIYCGDGFLDADEQCDCGSGWTDLVNFDFLHGGDGEFSLILSPYYRRVPTNPVTWAGLNDCSLPNGKYGASTSGASCSFDCKSAGPYCGDHILNGGEMCDGNSQSWAGKICTDNYTQCTDDTDCPGTNTCGVAGSNGRNACNPINLCSNDTSRSCTADANCSDIALNPSTGSCIAYPSARTRNCNSATCTSWASWGACTTNFGCGNGVKEGAEQCDDGVIGRARERKDNNDAC